MQLHRLPNMLRRNSLGCSNSWDEYSVFYMMLVKMKVINHHHIVKATEKKNDSSSARQEISLILWNPKDHYDVHNSPTLAPSLEQDESHPYHISWNYSLILSYELRLGLQNSHFLHFHYWNHTLQKMTSKKLHIFLKIYHNLKFWYHLTQK